MNQSNESYDVFISYNWNIKDQVEKFHQKLESSTPLRGWRDIDLRPTGLYGQLANQIMNSKMFLCLINKKYVESLNCRRELEFAFRISKPIIYLMIEKLDFKKPDELGNSVGFIMGDSDYTHCYKSPNSWWDDKFEEIKSSIETEKEV